MKLLGNTKSKINKNENGEKLLFLEITEVVLIHGNVANNTYQINQDSCMHLFVINLSVSYQMFTRKCSILKTFESEFSHVKVWFTQKILILWIWKTK